MVSELSNMTWIEAGEKLKNTRLAILPIGSVEQHGLHLGLGADWIQAWNIAKKVGEKSGKIVLPIMPYGVASHHQDFPGVISLKPGTLTDVVFDVLTSLNRYGVDRVLIINGHGGNLAAITEAVRVAREKFGMISAISQWWDILRGKPLFGQPAVAHAGYAETAFTLTSRPEAVRMDLAVLSETKQVDEDIQLVSLIEARFEEGYVYMPLNTSDVSNTGSMTEGHPDDVKGTKDYSKITKEFADDLMEQIIDWLSRFVEKFEDFEVPKTVITKELAMKDLN
jgi:creatinine amidohydrolase